MTEEIRDTFADRLARWLNLRPDEVGKEVCHLPMGDVTVIISRELTDSERRQYKMITGTRSVHVEGRLNFFGVQYHIAFSDRDGDGEMRGKFDEGGMINEFENANGNGILDSAQLYIGEQMNPLPQSFYRMLAKVIDNYFSLQYGGRQHKRK